MIFQKETVIDHLKFTISSSECYHSASIEFFRPQYSHVFTCLSVGPDFSCLRNNHRFHCINPFSYASHSLSMQCINPTLPMNTTILVILSMLFYSFYSQCIPTYSQRISTTVEQLTRLVFLCSGEHIRS